MDMTNQNIFKSTGIYKIIKLQYKQKQQELVELEAKKDDFLTRFNIDDFSYLMDRWQGKIDMCEAGELQWGLFVADKK